MSILETIRSAVWSLQSNKLRSFLSMLGIIIGVAAVVAIVSVGLGAQSSVLDMVSALGSNLIMISPSSRVARGGSVSGDATELFTVDLAQHMQDSVPTLSVVVPQVQTSGLLIYEGANLRATLVGTTPTYPAVTNYNVQSGRFLHDLDLEHGTPVAVLGSRIAENLFDQANPIGEQLTYAVGDRRYNFTIIGVMEPKGQVLMGNYDSQVYIPISFAMERLLRADTVSTLMAQATSSDTASMAVEQAEFLLFARLGTTDGFSITSQDEMLETMGDVAFTLRLMLGAIGGISLVVGGIGVMNIMLVSVSERTREIGTRKALGAKRRDLLLQFIVESLALSTSGGGIGLLVGVLVAKAVSNFGGWATSIEAPALITAFTFSALVGLVAGVYPAMQAAKLDPVIALSYE
ncbi:MAG TPA: ABC transporter permease [Limnochordia bacterium]|nr:ABC transporter permease [Limnochordia bacterium]